MRYRLIAACFLVGACSATREPLEAEIAAMPCGEARANGLATAEDFGPPWLPAAVWRMAYHGGHDYRAAVDIRYDIDEDGRVRGVEFVDFADNVPISHHRHLRQAGRRSMRDWRFDLASATGGQAVRGCEDRLVFRFDSRWDE